MDPNTFAPPPPSVAAIYQKQTDEWNVILSKLVALDTKEKAGALEMGDLFLTVEQNWGKAQVKVAADSAGIELGSAKARAWVSKKIPKDSSLRNCHLSYTHLRALATVPEDIMEEWAQDALENAWSSKRLKAELAAAGIKQEKPPKDPGMCIQCEQMLPVENDSAQMVIRWNQGGKHGALCTVHCAAAYFKERLEDDEGDHTAEPPIQYGSGNVSGMMTGITAWQ